MIRPRLIAFDGIDGCGKSSRAHTLVERLRARGIPCLLTKHPGGDYSGASHIRELLISDWGKALTPRARGLLFAVDRAEHAARVVRPALAEGRTVVVDRWALSQIAYRVAEGEDREEIEHLEHWSSGGLWPDATIVLDVLPEIALDRVVRRAAATGKDIGYFERRGPRYFEAVAAVMAQYQEDRGVFHFSGMLSPETVDAMIWHVLYPLFDAELPMIREARASVALDHDEAHGTRSELDGD